MKGLYRAVGSLLGLLYFSLPANGRLLKASAPSTIDEAQELFRATSARSWLKQGIQGYLYNNDNYTSFLAMAGAVPSYSTLLTGAWSQGPTNNTVLVPTNAAIQSAFEELGESYSVNSNASLYLNLINSTLGLTTIQTPLQTLFSAILNSHILSEPINLYASPPVLAASQNNPYSLPTTGLSILEAPVAYTDSDRTIFVTEPLGMLSGSVRVPKFYAQQRAFSNTTGNSTLYLYEVDSVLVASNILNGTQSSSTEEALKSLSRFLE